MKLKLYITTLICTTMLTSAAMAERKSWVSKFANSIKNIGQSSDQSNTLKVEAISQLNNAANAKADDIENSLVGGRWKYLELDLGATRNDDNKNKGSVSVKSVYSLKETKNSFIFNQSSFINYDGRSTVNLGFGARSINDDETYILGINVFYDYEIQAKHGRASLGIEAFTRDLDFRANYYQAISKAKTYNAVDETALDGMDVKLSYSHPMMNNTGLYAKYTKWEDDASFTSENNEIGITAKLSENLSLQIGSRKTKGGKRNTVASVAYSVPLGGSNATENLILTDKNLTRPSIRNKLYIPVERENRIIKKAIGSVVVKGY
jgi:hypothetical protein